MKLYEMHIHELPDENRFVRVSHPDGTVWAIPVLAILDRACRYYEANGWDDEDEEDFSGVQPTGDELRGIVLVNADFEQEARECRWSYISHAARLIAGPGTIPPYDDRIWWFQENDGEVKELTDLDATEQANKCGRLLCLDEWAYDFFVRTPARIRHELLVYFHSIGGAQ